MRVSAGLILILLAGCAAGPDYRLPEKAVLISPAARGTFDSGGEAAFVSGEPPDQWWRMYDDARLDAYITEALTANYDLKAADANLRRASFIVRETEAGRQFQTSISGSAEIAVVRGKIRSPESYTYDLGAGVSYALDLAGGIRRGIEAARANNEAVQAARDGVRVTVAAAVTRSYAAACSANATLAATQRVLDVQRETLGVTTRLKQGGRGTEFDVTRAKAAFDLSTAAIPEIIASRQAALYELAALMGRTPAAYPRELIQCISPPALRRAIPVGDGAQLLARRPDVRAAERLLHAATATIGLETANLYPRVSIGGPLGIAGPIAGFGTGSSFGGSLGPLLSWSFPNRAVARARIAEAGAAAEAASADFDGIVIEALRQTETALSAYAREADRSATFALSRDDARRATEQAGRLYRFGRTNFIDVLSAQSALANAEAAFAQSRALLVDRQIDLFLALGGGWGNDAPVETAGSAAAR
ncbi:efflux transporter outer membrane subunit [Sphingomonas sp. BIUV-7]|uniref:Efflux transporter outer membrane subunit n=1 Tax=Sphingomonas natans TaxID=3063330 RepID=A0ABT8Y8I5_9SPHN|nr:efflux transporter outer membrane subunit [Sphingomonas sp. BIUV-7]MDO6414193.1 efflux transporter outer membrane subunit [Sphingomonas sp. BIUV-7]